jgi:segregation and condensation protein B
MELDEAEAVATELHVLEEDDIAPDEEESADEVETEINADVLADAFVDAEERAAGRPAWSWKKAIDQRMVPLLIEVVNSEYEETGRAFRIVEVAGGFQFATTREFGEFVGLLSREKGRRRLSPAALETLSIIAYRQPAAKPDIETIRGVNCDQVLVNLLEKNLVAIVGRSEGVGRPLLYGTTDEFLRCFGLNNIGDLPKLREIEELMQDDVFRSERADITVEPTTDVEEIEALVGAAGHDRSDESTDGLPVRYDDEESMGTTDDISDNDSASGGDEFVEEIIGGGETDLDDEYNSVEEDGSDNENHAPLTEDDDDAIDDDRDDSVDESASDEDTGDRNEEADDEEVHIADHVSGEGNE